MTRHSAPAPLLGTRPPSLFATSFSLRGPAGDTSQRASRPWRRRLLLAACAGVAGSLLGWTAREAPRAEPVAGIPALKRTDDGELQRWAPGRVSVVLDPSLERISPHASERVIRSFGTWLGRAPELPDVQFVHSQEPRAGVRRDGKNTVSYAPITLDGHGRELGITVTYWDPESGEIVEADIVLNSMHRLAILDDGVEGREPRPSCMGEDERCEQGFDFESVVTHEVGHFFGLGEDRSARTATMFYCQSPCEVHKRSVEPSDTSPLAKLYASGTVTTSQAAGCGKSSSSSASWVD
ncbi:MAG TPA: matrixin family metalloprotease [Polyangiaceae bacterium]